MIEARNLVKRIVNNEQLVGTSEKDIENFSQQIYQLFPKHPDIEEVKKILEQNIFYHAEEFGDSGKIQVMEFSLDKAAQQIYQLFKDNPDEPKPNALTITSTRAKIILDFFEWCQLPEFTRQEIEEIQNMTKELKIIVGRIQNGRAKA